MYSTCLFCTKDLGQNEVIETLPVGRRIAFDAKHGRLWIICRGCARWNLVPFDSRLESIDEAERRFHDTRTRYSTDNIGLARLKEGLELVRIGPALRPEFASWRYGARFASRRRRALLVSGGVSVAILATYFGARAAVGSGFLIQQGMMWGPGWLKQRRIRVRHELGEGELLTLTENDVASSFIQRTPDSWYLGVNARTDVVGNWCDGKQSDRFLQLEAHEAEGLIARILPVVSGTAGTAKELSSATALLEADPSIMGITNARHASSGAYVLPNIGLKSAPPMARLALEMAANESTERRALEGELSLLERQWEEADRIARISDSLALPESIDTELAARQVDRRPSIDDRPSSADDRPGN